ncbi:MAG: cell division protein FtsQ/DivIB [Candidatus Competibacteraceae bacterium]
MMIPRVFFPSSYPLPRQPAPGWKLVFRRKRHGATARVTRTLPKWQFQWQPRLRWLGAVLALLAGGYGLYSGAHHVLEPAHFPLRTVSLQGELHNLDQAELQQLVQPYLGQNFFALDIGALQAVLAANPWIEQVSVHRQWPDRLKVYFQERTPFGHWGREEMVDVNGIRFRPTAVRQPGPWPRLAGPDGHETALIRYYRDADGLLKQAGLQLAELVQDERRAFRVVTADGLEVRLGRDHFLERLQRFVTIYPQLLADLNGKMAAVDLRYTHGFSVRWANPAGSTTTMVTTTPAVTPAAARPKGAKAG